MTRIFYGKYVPEDPLLAPLFANMSLDHPERVAAWLAEVFGGPKLHSERYGGYERMVSRHLGKALSEQQRSDCEGPNVTVHTPPTRKSHSDSTIQPGSSVP
jgi:truncated hemoglobin YjbI